MDKMPIKFLSHPSIVDIRVKLRQLEEDQPPTRDGRDEEASYCDGSPAFDQSIITPWHDYFSEEEFEIARETEGGNE